MSEIKKIALESIAIIMDEIRRTAGLSAPEDLKQYAESMLMLAEAFQKIKKS